MIKLGLTKDEILRSSFKSKHISRLTAADPENGRAEAMLLEYKE